MKIKANIIKVESMGDLLLVRAQGSRQGAARWQSMGVVEFTFASTQAQQAAFHVGRDIVVTVEPARENQRAAKGER